ncbi:hypothetical protein [Amycolatopsis sp. La24]|uniref:hypothetical protein n=1 Tax=Amycolatopsis sp. La24 TaxID=3028304 RepID=UPI0023B0BD04|nr:hypothetical protein [Amycolatopsis sp. La24]
MIREWQGTERILPGVTLVEAGGHFPGAAGLVRRLVDRLEPYAFDRLYALTGATVPTDAKAAVRRSAERYIGWVDGTNDHLG